MGQKQDKAPGTEGDSASDSISAPDGQGQTQQRADDTQSEYSTEWDSSDSETVSPTPETVSDGHRYGADPMAELVRDLLVRPDLNTSDNPSPERGVGGGGGGQDRGDER